MSKNFNDLLAQVSKCEMKKLSVAVAQDKPVLEAVKEAEEKGIATAILVGDKAQIESIAAEIGMDLTKHEIIDESKKPLRQLLSWFMTVKQIFI